uniref:Uncharacterized protein n=1 Tax=Arundo donax TaxID=35708 RepID=A0A0A9FVG6_ARUDO
MSTKPKPTRTKEMEKSLAAGVAGVMSPYPMVQSVTMQK